MNCTQCGSAIPEGSRFCQACGSPVQEQAGIPSQAPQPASPPQPVYQQPQQPLYQPYTQQPYGAPPYPGPPQKKKTGLIIGLIAGAVVLIGAAVALYLFVFSGTSVVGQWYCEERGQVLVFDDRDTVAGYALTGTVDAEYEYDKGKGEGAITASNVDLTFKVDKDKLVLTNEQTDDESTFVKTDKKSDAEDLVLSALQGLWSCEDIGEVLEFKNGKINTYSGYGDFNGTYDYDIDQGKGMFTINGVDFEFFADYDGLTVTNTGDYIKADKKLDIKAFVSEHSMPILGLWYDTSGTYGTIEFYQDGTAQLIMFDQPFSATYTFDIAAGTGNITADTTGESSPMTYKDGVIEIEGITYTQDYVEQMNAGDLPSLIGTWYETTGTQGDITFYEDGSFYASYLDQYIMGTYTFDPVSGQGQVTYESDGSSNTANLYLEGGVLQIDDSTYTMDYVAPVSASSIVGIWYDVTGAAGTITFYDDFSVLVDTYGVMLAGTYSFDAASETGLITLPEASNPDVMIYLSNGNLDVNGVQYTMDYVEQADYSGQ